VTAKKREPRAGKADIEAALTRLAGSVDSAGDRRYPGVNARRLNIIYKPKWDRRVRWHIHHEGVMVELTWNISPKAKDFWATWNMVMKEVGQLQRPHWPVSLSHLERVAANA